MGTSNSDDEIEIDLKELFFVLLRHIWMLILSTVICAGIAIVITKVFITPMYSSTAMLYVLTKTTSITSLADLQAGTQLTTDYEVFITSRPVVDKVIEDLDLNMDYEEFVQKVAVDNPSDSRILNITVQNADPQIAKTIVDDLANVSSARMAEVMETDAPNIVDYGHVAERKTSPSTTKNTLIGALLGLLTAGAFVVVRYLMDDTIKTQDDIEKYLKLNTLGVIPLEEGMVKQKKKKRMFGINANN